MLRNHLLDPEQNSQYPSRKSTTTTTVGSSSNIGNQHSDLHDDWYSPDYNDIPTTTTTTSTSMAQQPSPYRASSTISSTATPLSNNMMMMGGGNDMTNLRPLHAGMYEDDEANEPPLLEEIGIHWEHIFEKTKAVINPSQKLNEHILDDADLAGPIFFCLLLGSFLLLSGKVQFSYIYGFSVCGCIGMSTLINLLVPTTGLDVWKVCSVLGYCLLPVISLAGVGIVFNLKGVLGCILACLAIIWSTFSSTRLFDAKLNLKEQYWLVAYPVMLLYSCFVLMTIF